MYNIGDKVRVREDLEVGNSYGGLPFAEGMSNFKGVEAVITEVFKKEYFINVAKGDYWDWYFNDEMLELIEKVDLTVKRKGIAKFEKVSFEQFKKDWKETFGYHINEEEIQSIYDNIKLPVRATKGSAGHDFYSPIDITLEPNETIKIPTGIRVSIDNDWVLKCYPRSGLGFKFRLQLNNTVGIIDADYYHSDNEGHIFAKITNDTNENKTIEIKQGDGFMQGIFVQYGITVDDDVSEIRNGGQGSTNK